MSCKKKVNFFVQSLKQNDILTEAETVVPVF